MLEPVPLIKEALAFAVNKIKDGENPTEALFKTASKYDLNRNFTERVGEALNVSLHHSHFKTAADKSVDFDVAKIAEVIQRRYSSEEKSAKKTAYDLFPTAEYSDFIPDYNRIVSDKNYKLARMKLASEAEQPEKPMSVYTANEVLKQARSAVDAYEKVALEERGKLNEAKIKLATTFTTLVTEFKKNKFARDKFHDFESQVFAKHGEAEDEIVNEIYKVAKLSEERGKHDSKYWTYTQCKSARLYDAYKVAAENFIAQESAAMEAAFESKIAAEIFRLQKVKVADIFTKLKNFGDKKAPSFGEEVKPAEKTAEGFGSSFNLLEALGKQISKKFEGEKETNDGFKKNVHSDNMERRMLLQELMMIDPIISKEPASRVVAAFEQIMRVAPELSKQKEVMRMMLREILATQGLNTLTSNSLTEADINLMKRQMLSNGQHVK